MTGNRPVYSPPAAPPRQVPVVPPALPPVFVVPPAVDRWHYYRLFALWGWGLAGVVFAVGQGVVSGAGLYGAGVGALTMLAAWAGTHRDYSAALRVAATTRGAQAQKLAAEMAEWQASLDAERAALAQWSAHEHGATKAAASPAAPTVNHAQAHEQHQAALRAALVAETVKAVVAELTPLLQPAPAESARVVAPPVEVETRHLDMRRGPLAAAYADGPTALLVERAWRKEPIANNQVCPAWMSNKQWRQIVTVLGQAGVLVSDGPRQPWQLAADLTPANVTDLHTQVVDWLLAAGCVPDDLPGSYTGP